MLLGEDGSSFGQATYVDAGRTLQGLVSGDLNQDGIPDIAVVDVLDGKLIVIIGKGQGIMNMPVSYPVGLWPSDLAIGNFDSQKGNDLVVCGHGTRGISIYVNQGDGQFIPVTIPAGAAAKRCKAADLNGDGLDDIVVLEAGTDVADDIAVLMNRGSGNFEPAARFAVGAGATDFVIADFNDDGAPDLATLNAGSGMQTTFSVSILLNEVHVVNGTPVGTRAFTSAPPVPLNCPSLLNGVPILCHPNFLAAGDFDNDGFSDFAVTIFTEPRVAGTSSAATSGLVQAFQGHGTGAFDLATQVTVGNNPQGIVAADFDGDDTLDLAIAEQGSFSVRILNALPFPRGRCGGLCALGQQCSSGFCVDGVCCSVASCPAGQGCNMPGMGGVCAPPAPNGYPCCGSEQCASGQCTDGVCCQDDRCAAGSSCNIPGFEGTCAELQCAGWSETSGEV